MSFLYELHCHTAESSRCASASAEAQVAYYKSRGFDGIVITDHFLGGNTTAPAELGWHRKIDLFCRGYENALRAGEKYGLKVFFSWEFSHLGCDFLTYGLSKEWLLENENLEKMSIGDYLRYVRSEGAYVAHAHPFREDFYIPYIQLLPRQVDAVETINACRKEFENERAAEYARAYGLPAIAGSDNHTADRQKRLCGISTETEANSMAELIQLLRDDAYRLYDSRETT